MFECPADCDCCGEAPASVDGICDYCDWQIRREALTGIRKLELYLQRWAEFDAWLVARA